MSLKAKIEAVIYASEEPVTVLQLVGLLAEEAQAEMDKVASLQAQLPLSTGESEGAARSPLDAGSDLGEGQDCPENPTSRSEITLNEVADPGTFAQVAAASFALHPEATSDSAPAPDDLGNSEPTQATQGISVALPTESSDAEKRHARERERALRDHLRGAIDDLVRDYAESDRGIEVREVAGGFRMGTKPEYHDAVRGFIRLLKPALKLTLQALETLAVVAYKQPVTAAEISEIRGVDSAGVLGGLIARKLLATAGRKQVIGRPMLYKTTREFLVRFGLKDLHELPSMEEFERMAGELNEQEDLPLESTDTLIERANARGDADHIREHTGKASAERDSNEGFTAGPHADSGRQTAEFDDGPIQSRSTPEITKEAKA